MSYLRIFHIALFLLTSIAVQAQNRSEHFRLGYHFFDLIDEKMAHRSGYHIPIEFHAEATRKPIIKSCKFGDSDLIVTVGVQYIYKNETDKGKPISMRVAIAITSQEEDNLFALPISAITEQPYNKHKNGISVSTKVTIAERTYSISLFCDHSFKKR